MAAFLMSILVVALPEEDLDFLKAFSASRGITAEAVWAGHARRLREIVESDLHPDVVAMIGMIEPMTDCEVAYLDHLDGKHS